MASSFVIGAIVTAALLLLIALPVFMYIRPDTQAVQESPFVGQEDEVGEEGGGKEREGGDALFWEWHADNEDEEEEGDGIEEGSRRRPRRISDLELIKQDDEPDSEDEGEHVGESRRRKKEIRDETKPARTLLLLLTPPSVDAVPLLQTYRTLASSSVDIGILAFLDPEDPDTAVIREEMRMLAEDVDPEVRIVPFLQSIRSFNGESRCVHQLLKRMWRNQSQTVIMIGGHAPERGWDATVARLLSSEKHAGNTVLTTVLGEKGPMRAIQPVAQPESLPRFAWRHADNEHMNRKKEKKDRRCQSLMARGLSFDAMFLPSDVLSKAIMPPHKHLYEDTAEFAFFATLHQANVHVRHPVSIPWKHVPVGSSEIVRGGYRQAEHDFGLLQQDVAVALKSCDQVQRELQFFPRGRSGKLIKHMFAFLSISLPSPILIQNEVNGGGQVMGEREAAPLPYIFDESRMFPELKERKGEEGEEEKDMVREDVFKGIAFTNVSELS